MISNEIFLALIRAEKKTQGARAYIVGGFPRDILVKNKLSDDIDVIVFGADYRSFAKTLIMELGNPKYFEVERYSLVRIIVNSKLRIDVSAPKADTLEQDLRKRDFTINTLVIPVSLCLVPEKNILDPLGEAMLDIKSLILRTPFKPFRTIKDDPVRIVRCARFMSDGFKPDPLVIEACREHIKRLAQEPRERIGEEIRRLFLAKKPSEGLIFLRDLGFFNYVYPPIVPALYKEQRSPYHYEGVFEHCVRVVDIMPPDIVLRLSAFFHDIGKAFQEKVLPDGRVVYWGHEEVSAHIASSFLSLFGFPADERAKVVEIVRNHMIYYSPDWTDSAVRRLIKRLGDNIDMVLKFVEFDIRALRDPSPKLESLKHLKERITREVIKLGSANIKSPIDGYEIQKIFGIPPGKLIGEIKKAVEDAIVEGKIKPTKRSAIRFIRKFLSEREISGNADRCKEKYQQDS